jgi:hypothetical protein
VKDLRQIHPDTLIWLAKGASDIIAPGPLIAAAPPHVITPCFQASKTPGGHYDAQRVGYWDDQMNGAFH